jgi:hypothetical protein
MRFFSDTLSIPKQKGTYPPDMPLMYLFDRGWRRKIGDILNIIFQTKISVSGLSRIRGLKETGGG